MKKNKTNQPDKTKAHDPATPVIKKSSLASKLLKSSVYFSLFLFLLIAGTGVVLEYYFPAEEVRVFAEKEGTKQLKLPLSIQKIKLSLLSGVRIDGVTIGPASKPLARVQSVVLDYDLSQLLQGHLVINQVLVDQPQLNAVSKNGVWNFQPLLNLKDSNNTPPPSSNSSASLPFAKIDLQQFNVRNAGATLVMDDQISAHIKGLNIEAQGKASIDEMDLKLRVIMNPDPKANIFFKQKKEKIHIQSHVTTDMNFSAKDLKKLNVSGNFGFKKNQIQFGDVLPAPNLEGSLSADVQLQPEHIHLSALSLTLDEENKVVLSTKIKNFSTSPEIEAHIKKVSFQLADLLRWGAKWLPPISGHGTLETENLTLQAKLPGFKPDNIILEGGPLSTKDLTLDYSNFKIHIEKLNSSLLVNEVSLKGGGLEKVSANLKMDLAKGQAQGAEILNWKQALTFAAEGSDLSQIKMSFNADIDSLHYDHPLTKKVNLPFHTEGSLHGNWKQGDLTLQKISYHSGNLIKGTLTGTVKRKNSFQIQKGLTLDINEALKILPQEISEKMPNLQAAGQTKAAFSFTGELDSKFSPININGNTEIHLKGVSAKLGDPVIHIEDLNTSIQFPVAYKAEKGLKVPTLDINTTLKRVDALKNWKLTDFSVESKFGMDTFYNLKPAFGTLPIKLDSHIKLGRLHSNQPELSISDFNTNAHLKGDLRSDDFRNSQLRGNVSFQNINALKKFSVGKVASQFSLQVHDKSLSRIRLSQKTKITSVNIDELRLKEMNIESLTRKNFPDGNFDLDKFHFAATDIFSLNAKGNVKNWGESFALESNVDNLQLASIWKQVPANMKKSLDLKGLDGKAGLSFKSQGKLPPSKNLDLKPHERWTKLFVSFDPDNLPPIEISSRFHLQNGKVSHLDKNLQELNLDSQLDFKNGSAELSGNTSGKLQDMEYFEKLPLHPEFKFQYHLKNLNTFVFKKHQLDLKNRGVTHTLEGKVDGLRSFLKGPFDPARLLQKINLDLKNENHLKIDDAMKEELFGNIKATGELSSQIKIHQTAGESISLEGRIGFNRFNTEIPSAVALKNLTGNFPFSKALSLSPIIIFKNTASPTEKSFFKQLRDFSRYKNNITADSLEAVGQKVENMGMDIVFKDNRLAADKFIFDVLGGTVGGNFSFTQTPKGPTLKFATEFAKIDLSRLLPSDPEKSIDSKIDGNMEMAFEVETADVSLDKLSLKIAITKIGTKTLDRLLLFIDPEESKPAIVDTRAKLKIAAPHRVLISLENGNLNLEAWLKSDLLGIIKAPELKRIPIGGLKQFATINEQLQSLQETLKTLNIIAAKRILFEEEKLVFKN